MITNGMLAFERYSHYLFVGIIRTTSGDNKRNHDNSQIQELVIGPICEPSISEISPRRYHYTVYPFSALLYCFMCLSYALLQSTHIYCSTTRINVLEFS